MSAPVLDTALCRLVGVRHPVVQTGMGWVAGPRLVSATAEAGGLGVLASATMSFEQLRAAIREVTDAIWGPEIAAHPNYEQLRELLFTSMRGAAMPYAFEDRPPRTDPHLELWKSIAHRLLSDPPLS